MDHSKVKFLLILMFLFLGLSVSKALTCQLNNWNNPNKVAFTIVVDKSGRGNFTTIQRAIDSIPFHSTQWIRVQISPGIFCEKVTIINGKSCIFLDGAGKEKVTIINGKSCIFLDGAGKRATEIQWNGHATTAESATFTSFTENLVVRGITFRNVYNAPGTVREYRDIVPAVAALIEGDKSAFFECSFVGLQDTLWDGSGRHFYKHCYIEGAIDFISGSGQSIYDSCEINVSVGLYAPAITYGYITAQERNSPTEPNGFVFKRCSVVGSGRAYLGRGYKPYSTVIFFDSYLSPLVDPAGWDAGLQFGHENKLTFAEVNCYGAGADTSRRVPWLKELSADEIKHFVHMSFIDPEGWTSRLPISFY